MKEGKQLVRLQTYVPAELAKLVEDDAAKNHRPVTGEIWYILEQYFKQQSGEPGEKKPLDNAEE